MPSGDMSLQELIQAANRLCRKHWGCDYTGKIELVNTKWKSMLACYLSDREDPKVQIIRMSKKTNAGCSRDKVLDNLLHELVHWRLHTTGQPFGDEEECFVAECIRVGAEISGTKVAVMTAKRVAEKMLAQPIRTVGRPKSPALCAPSAQMTLF